jgi:hypothetical protein
MAKHVIRTRTLSVNGTDLSDHVSSVGVEVTTDEVDLTAMGATYREFGQGLSDANITATLFNDFAASSVDAVLWPLSQSGGTFTVKTKPTSATVSTTNPEYSMISRLFGYSPLGGGGVGDAATVDVTFRNADQTGLARGTA